MPVMLAEAVEYLKCRDGAIIVDCTLGEGGHAEAILNKISPTGVLVGIDRDKEAIDVARVRLAAFSQQIKIFNVDFGNLSEILKELQISTVDGALFDLGVSSAQLDNPLRGFSYRFSAPLDMRMDTRDKVTAADIVNSYTEKDLALVIKNYGEERWASRIAHFIVERRKRKSIKTTDELVKAIKDAIPAAARRKGGHPAKRTFQALRIEVNRELENLGKTLFDVARILKKGGRLVVISYHSLEDRIVKESFKKLATGCICPDSSEICRCGGGYRVRILTRKPLRPNVEEVRINPRARSAKLRAAEKL